MSNSPQDTFVAVLCIAAFIVALPLMCVLIQFWPLILIGLILMVVIGLVTN